jgi:cytochrome c oxidase cbb3-type subunit 3
MNNEHDPLLMDHEADGIRELDNKLPRWWVWLFYLSTIFAIGYFCFYHVLAIGLSSHAVYEKEMEVGNALKQVALEKFERDMGTREPTADEVVIADGRNTFMALCAPCHRHDGGGLVGPNLTDEHWIHGANFTDNLKVVWNGVPEKGMVTWKGVLTPDQIYAVTSYIYTLRGSNPPNPKPAEATGGAAAAPAENLYE